MNRLTITGRLTQDPDLVSLPSGDSVCNLRLAVDGMAPGRETGYVAPREYVADRGLRGGAVCA